MMLCPQWGPGLRPGKVGVCHAHPRNAFQQGVCDSSHLCQGTTIVWGSKGGETRQGKASRPPPSPGTEYVQALRLLQGPQLEEGGRPAARQDLHLPCEYPLSKGVTLNSKFKNTQAGQESNQEREERLHIVPLTVHVFLLFEQGECIFILYWAGNWAASPAVLWSDHVSL